MNQSSFKKIIRILAVIIAMNAFWCMILLMNPDWYWYIFQYLPQDVVMMRYLLSWLGRIGLIVGAIGIFSYKELYRKFILILTLINLSTIYWKHPFQAFQYSLQYHGTKKYLENLLSQLGMAGNLKAAMFLCLYVPDILFFLIILVFLTRPGVKKCFA